VATSPVDGAGYAARSTGVAATFSRSMDPATITSSSFTLTGPGGLVAGSVAYDGASRTATLTPSALLAGGVEYTARIETTVKAADGIGLAAPVSWTFSTAACPCTLFSPVSQPALQGLPTQDGRSGPGPWSYELGVKVTVDQPMLLTAIRFYKSPGETGTHIGRVWTSGGAQLAQTTFVSETASGWQQQALATPLQLQAGAVYVVSANANAFFSTTTSGLQSQVITGPLRSVADGQNGVHSQAAAQFPTQSWSSSNYFVDLVVR